MQPPPHLAAAVEKRRTFLDEKNEEHIRHARDMLERIDDELVVTATVTWGILDASDLDPASRGAVVAELLARMYVQEAARRLGENPRT